MAGNTDNPRIWIDGDVWVAAVASTPPTTPTVALTAAWQVLGLLSEDGLTESRDEDSTDFFAWGGILVRTRRSKHKRTFQVAALEDNLTVFGLVNPGSTQVVAGGIATRTIMVPDPDPRSFVFETHDGTIDRRIYIARGEVTEVGDIVSSDSEMTMRELTITAYPDANGVLYKEITDDPQADDLTSS